MASKKESKKVVAATTTEKSEAKSESKSRSTTRESKNLVLSLVEAGFTLDEISSAAGLEKTKGKEWVAGVGPVFNWALGRSGASPSRLEKLRELLTGKTTTTVESDDHGPKPKGGKRAKKGELSNAEADAMILAAKEFTGAPHSPGLAQVTALLAQLVGAQRVGPKSVRAAQSARKSKKVAQA